MARGGRRSGVPGAQYSNRTDLQTSPRLAPTANVGQPYGTAKSQLDSQSAVPMSAPPVIPIAAPTNRPNEPIQSGLPTGPGPGPQTIPSPTPDPTEVELRGLYARFPNRDLAALLEMIDKGQTF